MRNRYHPLHDCRGSISLLEGTRSRRQWNPDSQSLCENSRFTMWGGLSAGSRPLGGFCLQDYEPAGSRLPADSPPHLAVFTQTRHGGDMLAKSPIPPSASILRRLEEPDQGVRCRRGRPPYFATREVELWPPL